MVDALVPQALVLARKYPDLINLDGKMRDIRNVFNFTHECNFTEMQASQQFSNDLIDNAARMKTFVQTLIGQEQILKEVHLALDRELGIVHRELIP